MKKLTYEFVKSEIEKEGYELLSKEYNNANSKINVRCPNGHIYDVTYGHFYSGKRCPECSHPSKKHSYNFIKGQIEKEGYELLSNKYKGNKEKLLIKCNKGHEFWLSYHCFQGGYRCLVCAGNKKLTYEFVKSKIEKEGYKLLSTEYKNAREKLELKCNENHVCKISLDNFNKGRRCSYCNPMYSKSEKEIAEYIKSFGIDIIENDRKQIINPLTNYPLELDIWIPDLNKAIEFNGRYWHNFEEAKRRDGIKKQECEEMEIDLFVLEEQDWMDDKNKCLNKIKDFICL